ncbi:hypothetical protein [Actinoplanes sp. CA-252034]|uniref:hypothetical protein n=1 Tax=Actinoplanes sp. CA-252034 TaxID=3239906 RepID=UPI003D99EF29
MAIGYVSPIPPGGGGGPHTHTPGQAGADPAGTAAVAAAAHASAGDPHPQYATTAALGTEAGARAASDAALDDRLTALEEAPAGGGNPLIRAHGYVRSGDVVPQATASWAPLVGGPTFTIAATVGDEIEFRWSGLLQNGSGLFYDVAVVVNGLPVRYASSGEAVPAAEGDPGLYPDSGFRAVPGLGFTFTAQAGDLDDGGIRIGFAVKNPNGVGRVFAGVFYPLRWALTNYGAAA